MAGEVIVQQASGGADVIPFTEFVVKTTPSCSLEPRFRDGVFVGGCDYYPAELAAITNRHGCYEYASGKTHRQPMNQEVIRQAAYQIGVHAARHGLPDVRIMKHGGEPLLLGPSELDTFSDIVLSTISKESPDTNIHLLVQTNGLPLAPERTKDEPRAEAILTTLKKYNYGVGLSLDGDQAANDRHRRDRQGKSTYDRAVRAAARLRDSGFNWRILCVVDTNNDPIATVESLASHKPNDIRLLLPHANHSVPKLQGPLSAGDWLIAAFDWYFDQPKPPAGQQRLTMPIFDSYMLKLVGGPSLHESVGNRMVQEAFIRPDGAIEGVDTLRSTVPEVPRTGMNVFDHSFDQVAQYDSGFIARRLGNAGLAKQCLECPLVVPCGGGYYPHRFKAGPQAIKVSDPPEVYAAAFRHATVYCEDQHKLLPHIAARMEEDMGLPQGRLLQTLAAQQS